MHDENDNKTWYEVEEEDPTVGAVRYSETTLKRYVDTLRRGGDLDPKEERAARRYAKLHDIEVPAREKLKPGQVVARLLTGGMFGGRPGDAAPGKGGRKPVKLPSTRDEDEIILPNFGTRAMKNFLVTAKASASSAIASTVRIEPAEDVDIADLLLICDDSGALVTELKVANDSILEMVENGDGTPVSVFNTSSFKEYLEGWKIGPKRALRITIKFAASGGGNCRIVLPTAKHFQSCPVR